jgi:acetyl esterase/lipase
MMISSVHIPYGDAPEQFGELSLPPGETLHPVVLLLHAGFWRNRHGLELMRDVADDLAAHGIASWNIEYRRVGDPGGGWPGTLNDVASAAYSLHRLASLYPLDLQRTVAVGHSAGGHLALWLAAWSRFSQENDLPTIQGQDVIHSRSIPLTGAISLAGIPDLELAWQHHLGGGVVDAFLGGSPIEFPERYRIASPSAFLPLRVPQVLIHGTEDPHVPLELSRSYAALARQAGDQITLLELPGVDHGTLRMPQSAAWAKTVEIVQQMIGRERSIER